MIILFQLSQLKTPGRKGTGIQAIFLLYWHALIMDLGGTVTNKINGVAGKILILATVRLGEGVLLCLMSCTQLSSLGIRKGGSIIEI